MEEVNAPTNEPDIPDGANDNRNPTRTLNVDPSIATNVGKFSKEQMDANEEMNEFYNTHFLVLAVKNYQKSSLWWCLAIAFCAMRAATGFTVFLAYMSLLSRII